MSHSIRPITVEELQSIRLPIVNYAEGYVVSEVNMLLGRCVEALRNGYGLSADEVERHSFTTTYMGGYAMGDVDMLLDRIVWTLRSRPSGEHVMIMGRSGVGTYVPPRAQQPYAQPMPSQHPITQQPPSVIPPQAQTSPQPTTLNDLLSKARKNAEKFAKDNDLEGKFEIGKAKAKEALSKAKAEADRAARSIGNSVDSARSAYEERRLLREQADEEKAARSPQFWNEPLYDDSSSHGTAPIRPIDKPRMTSHATTKDASVSNHTKTAEGKPKPIAATENVPEGAETEHPVETIPEQHSEEQTPTCSLSDTSSSVDSEPAITMETPEIVSVTRNDETRDTDDVVKTRNEPGAASLEPADSASAAAKGPTAPPTPRSSESRNQPDRRTDQGGDETQVVPNGFAALLVDKRKRMILIGCAAALILFAAIAYVASQPSDDSKDGNPAAASYSDTADSDDSDSGDSEDEDKPTTPSFETIDTSALKNRSAKDAMMELEGKGLSYRFLIDGEDGDDQTATVKTALRNGEKWNVIDAEQSATDGEVTLTVRKKETTQQKPKTRSDGNETITTANNAEFAALLALKDPSDPSVAAFAEKYKGRTIEFDGNIANVIPNDKHPQYLYDYTLVHGGDYSTENVSGPDFRFEGIMWSDFHDGSVGIPSFVREGQNIHAKATVGSYNSDNGILKLDLVEMTAR